ncbi:MAG: hypothetical protein RBR86_01700 [Pseudobdellovibrionaceae bacterium]|jgi:hypothetical protein|nr:hypothetical protein [Pseudobdellovibrionaceae bacterium]
MEKEDAYLTEWKNLLGQFNSPAFDTVADLVEQLEAFSSLTKDKDLFKEHDLLVGKNFKSQVTGRWLNNGLAYLIDVHGGSNPEHVLSSVMVMPLDNNKIQIVAVRNYDHDEVDGRRFSEFDFTGVKLADEDQLRQDVYRAFHEILVWALPPVDRPLFAHTLNSASRYDLSPEVINGKFVADTPEGSIRAYFHSMTTARDKADKSPSALGEMREKWQDHLIAMNIRMAAV